MNTYSFRLRTGVQSELDPLTGRMRHRALITISGIMPTALLTGPLGDEGDHYAGKWGDDEAAALAQARKMAAELRAIFSKRRVKQEAFRDFVRRYAD